MTQDSEEHEEADHAAVDGENRKEPVLGRSRA